MAVSPLAQCSLPYPDRFHAAVRFLEHWEAQDGASKLSNETRLILYALQQQSTVGNCMEPRPSSWSLVESVKWQAWKHIANMPKFEAMHKFVRTIEEEQPDWWKLVPPISEPAVVENGSEAASGDADLAGSPATQPQENGHFSGKPHETDGTSTHDGSSAAPNGSAVSSSSAQPQPAIHEHPPPPSLAEQAQEGTWTVATVAADARPIPRYEHASAALLNKLYIFGGCGLGSRHLADVWVLDLLSMVWKQLPQGPSSGDLHAPDSSPTAAAAVAPMASQQPSAVLPPCAGHTAVRWHNKILLVGGRSKARHASTDLIIRTFDPVTNTWGLLGPMSGEAPPARGGHSATLIGGCLYIFGGEDSQRRPLNDLWVLDLDAMSWLRPASSGEPPAPRAAHAACVVQNRHLLLFGGGSGAACLNDLAALDSATMTWSRPAWRGAAPVARAGHAGAVMGDKWYIVGGGNMVRGCADMLCIDLGPVSTGGPLAWSTVCTLPPRSPLCSEGLTLMALPAHHELLAFGGYNGDYSAAVSVYQVSQEDAAAESREPAAEPEHTGPSTSAASVAAPEPPASPLHRMFSRGSDWRSTSFRSNVSSVSEDAAQTSTAAIAALEGARRDVAAARDTITLLQRQVLSLKQELAESDHQLVETRAKLQSEQLHRGQTESENVVLRHRLLTAEQVIVDLQTQLDEERQRLRAKSSSGLFGWGSS